MTTKSVVFRAIAGVALTATLAGGSAMVAAAADARGLDHIAAQPASGVSSEVLAAEASTTSTATTAADPGSGPATSQANKDDHAWQAGPDHCEDWQLAMDYRERPDLSTSEALGFDLVFTNVGPRPCSFDGWPGLVAESADGETLTWALASGSTSTLVVVPSERRPGRRRRHGGAPVGLGLCRDDVRPPAGVHLLGWSGWWNRR